MNPLSEFSQRLKEVPQEKWDRLAQKRVYFGHQSVGQNILDGIKTVMNSFPKIHLNIVEHRTPRILPNRYLLIRASARTVTRMERSIIFEKSLKAESDR